MQLPTHSQDPGLDSLAEFLLLQGLLRGHLLQAHLEFGRANAWCSWRWRRWAAHVDHGRGCALHAFAHRLPHLFCGDSTRAWRGRWPSSAAAHVHDGGLLWRLAADDLREAVLALA